MNVADAYALGHIHFMGIDLLVDRGALVPREETELLGETALAVLAEQGETDCRIVDMCCGCGNLACAIATRIPSATIWATDLTDGCVAITRRNVAHTRLDGRVTVRQGDLFQSLTGLGLEGTIGMVVCNPPYISETRLDSDRAHLLEHEPREAFAAGPYGLGIHQKVIREAASFLKPGGYLLFEFGLGQERQLKALFARAKIYADLRFISNPAGEPRVAVARMIGDARKATE